MAGADRRALTPAPPRTDQPPFHRDPVPLPAYCRVMGIRGGHRSLLAGAALLLLLASGLVADEAAAATPPSIPRSVVAAPGPGSATVTWRAPSSNGGAAITRYRVVRSAPGVPSTTFLLGAQRRSLQMTGLTPGTTYRFSVQARNALGWGRAKAVTAVPGALAGFGTILGSCGVVAPQLGVASPSVHGDRTFGFGDHPYDDPVDRSSLTPGAQAIIEAGNLGGSALISQVFAFEVLARCEQASLVKTANQIVYDAVGAKTDLLVQIAGQPVGIEVARAFTFPSGSPYTLPAATTTLTDGLVDINESTQNVAVEDAWVKQVLVVMAVDQQHADVLSEAWLALDATTKADTVVYVVVTDGSDTNVYLNS